MSPTAHRPDSLPARMGRRIEVHPETGCWLWTGTYNRPGPRGYGQIYYEGKTALVNRVVFKLLVGEIPEGFQLSHAQPRPAFHNRCCCPDAGHLEPVTQQDALRRRDWDRARARRTHCPQDHEYTAENSYVDGRGFRECRTCRGERDSARVR